MNPNYRDTITVYRCVEGAWERDVFDNCFWIETEGTGGTTVQALTSQNRSNGYTVRIPVEAAGEGWKASINDIVILGYCAEEITKDYPATKLLLENKPYAFRVSFFKDNTRFPLDKHYRLGG